MAIVELQCRKNIIVDVVKICKWNFTFLLIDRSEFYIPSKISFYS